MFDPQKLARTRSVAAKHTLVSKNEKLPLLAQVEGVGVCYRQCVFWNQNEFSFVISHAQYPLGHLTYWAITRHPRNTYVYSEMLLVVTNYYMSQQAYLPLRFTQVS